MKEQTQVGDLLVSTVRLSNAHEWTLGGGYWYETMVFYEPTDGEGHVAELFTDRYRTEAPAMNGHQRVVKRLNEDADWHDKLLIKGQRYAGKHQILQISASENEQFEKAAEAAGVDIEEWCISAMLEAATSQQTESVTP